MMHDPTLALGVVIGFLIWTASVAGGIRLAIEKGYSPHWLWLGLIPPAALVMFIVMFIVEPKQDHGAGWSTLGRRGPLCGHPYCAEECLEPACPSERRIP